VVVVMVLVPPPPSFPPSSSSPFSSSFLFFLPPSYLPTFLSFLPISLASLRPCVLASLLPCVLASLRPCVLASLRPLVLWTFGPLDLWTFGPLDLWTFGPWTFRPSVLPLSYAFFLPSFRTYLTSLPPSFCAFVFPSGQQVQDCHKRASNQSALQLPTCPICMETLNASSVPKMTKCGHVYCFTCIIRFLQVPSVRSSVRPSFRPSILPFLL
jgi:hypothetical protein